ncbi:8426_t:CDS:1 [Cetraspora pellucida]|uniref:8426_t:CDS:1 n=1 Tax=Cetraspora pellucida TaxID=1433469 RepID=A0ACA9P9L4_9GLOM|nr:8426_t:CDS:1 [Cetraspora pellucida]
MEAIKVTYNNTTHQVTLSSKTNWDSLKSQLCDLFKIPYENSISLSYTDHNGDTKTFSSDSEFGKIPSDQISTMKFILSEEDLGSSWILEGYSENKETIGDSLDNKNTQLEGISGQDSTKQSIITLFNNFQITSSTSKIDSDEIIQEFFNVWLQSSCGYNTRFGSFKRHLYLIFGDRRTYAYIYISPQYNQATVGAQYCDYTIRPRKYLAMNVFNEIKNTMKKLFNSTKGVKGMKRLIILMLSFLTLVKLIYITLYITKIGLTWIGFFTVIGYIKNNYSDVNDQEESTKEQKDENIGISPKNAIEFGKRCYGDMKQVIEELLE